MLAAASIRFLMVGLLRAAALACALLATQAMAAECVVPSKPGGGFDLTCKLAQKSLPANTGDPMHLSFLPGGIGAVAWSSIVSQRRAEPDTLVAFSGGLLLNIALGKFGRATPADVRWVAAYGTDYGMIAVRADSPYKNLHDLLDAMRRDPANIAIGTGGTIGSQDWLKMALLAKQSGADPKAMRVVAFEGGGESFTALMAGHVQVVSGDVSEAILHLGGAANEQIRVLAVLADARLPGPMANVPTSHEQGYDITWPPIVRGVYMGPGVSDKDYRRWVNHFDRAMASPEFAAQRAKMGFYPFAMSGAALTDYINRSILRYAQQARELGLVK
jgi:putative tricarboxylic transport membrane protein